MVTSLDLRRITQLLMNSSMMGKLPTLEEKLFNSKIILPEEAPLNLITMNSEIIVNNLTTEERHAVRLVYQLSPMYGNQTSVLSPLGTALLGMKVHESVSYKLKNGEVHQIQVEGILFQPEACRQYEL